VTVIVRRPGPPLGGVVRAITYQAGEQPRASVEKILPGPGASLWVNLNQDEFRSYSETGRAIRVPGAMLAGPTSRAAVIEFEQGRAHVSVTFALGAAACFFASSLELARDRQVPLADVWGRPGGSLRERLLEAATPYAALDVMEDVLLSGLKGTPDPMIMAAGGALSAGVRVGEVAAALGVLPRTLRRRFTAQVGLSPKRFARVQRLQRVVRDLDGQAHVDWASVAARHGYADQPHLAEEFRQLVSVTPTEYLRSRVNGPNHLRFNVPTIVSSALQASLVTARDAPYGVRGPQAPSTGACVPQPPNHALPYGAAG
jgi:AraC-like DNA-binding protein